MLVNYSIKCEDGQIAFLYIASIELEDKNCMDPNLGEQRFARVIFNNVNTVEALK